VVVSLGMRPRTVGPQGRLSRSSKSRGCGTQPAEVERLIGPRAETETLLTLRRGTRVWPPLQRLPADAAPDQLRLTDDEPLARRSSIAPEGIP
jgi:hypothetical protein